MNHEEAYSADYLADILASVKTIAMVGASPDPVSYTHLTLPTIYSV